MTEEKKKGGFISGIVAELKKVTWLSWGEALRLTGMVLVIAILIGGILGGVDYLFSFLVKVLFVSG